MLGCGGVGKEHKTCPFAQGETQSWTVASVSGTFDSASTAGFWKNFTYIKDAKIPMTGPVLCAPEPKGSDQWHVSFFVPHTLHPSPETIPAPREKSVAIASLPATGVVVAVVSFGGKAGYREFKEAEEKLRAACSAAGVPLVDRDDASAPFRCAYAQYDAPFELFSRRNEVWLQVDEEKWTA
jgi:SOUL heme-binding protein